MAEVDWKNIEKMTAGADPWNSHECISKAILFLRDEFVGHIAGQAKLLKEQIIIIEKIMLEVRELREMLLQELKKS